MDKDSFKLKHQFGGSLFQGDKVVWMVFFFLCTISLIEVYSAASSLSYSTGNYMDPILNHWGNLMVGLIIVLVCHNIPCRWFKFYPILMLPVSILLLLYVFLFGPTTNGAARWLPGVPIQPSELGKSAVIVAVSLILSAMQTEKGADRHAMKYILWASIPVCLLIFPENFSTSAFLFLVVLFMMFFGRVPLIQMGKLLGVLAIFLAIGLALLLLTPKDTLRTVPGLGRLSVWKERIEKFTKGRMDPTNGPEGKKTKQMRPKDFDVENNSQWAYANIAIASSNIVGKLPGNSVERDFLQQAFSDFIYAIIIEEMGLLGGGFVLLLYLILLFRASRIANKCERNFPAFLALGLALLMVTQAFINMAVAVGLFPITGQPLPLISRGGSSILMNCVYIGMILSVSRFAKRRSNTKLSAKKAQSEVSESEKPFVDDNGMV